MVAMSIFKPGTIIKTETSKSGRRVTLRMTRWEDLDDMTAFINELSKEDTYITFSGEEITREAEAKYLGSVLANIEIGETVKIVAEVDGKIAGICDVNRNKSAKTRKLHIGVVGLSLRKTYRGDGIGELLLRTAIETAKQHIAGLTMLTLEVYGSNNVAQSLYKKIGFTECGRLPHGCAYKGDYIDDIIMCMQLE